MPCPFFPVFASGHVQGFATALGNEDSIGLRNRMYALYIEPVFKFSRQIREAALAWLGMDKKYPHVHLADFVKWIWDFSYPDKNKWGIEFKPFLGHPMCEPDLSEEARDIFDEEFDNNVLIQSYAHLKDCLLYTSPSPRDGLLSRMPSSA